jgi:hypothetical protein
VICELLGLPLADRPRFTAWASRFTGFTSSLGLLRALPGILAMKRYLQQRLDRTDGTRRSSATIRMDRARKCDQVLEVRKVDGRLHIARKPRQWDEWDPYVPPYDPYGPGASVIDDAGHEAIDDCNRKR